MDLYSIEVDIELDVQDVYHSMSTREREEMVELLRDDGTIEAVSISDMEVDEVYRELDPYQQAHLFNKLLKHGGFNPAGVSIETLLSAVGTAVEAQTAARVQEAIANLTQQTTETQGV